MLNSLSTLKGAPFVKRQGAVFRHCGGEKQQAQVARARAMEDWRIPEDIDYDCIESLRIEARQKLKAKKPLSLSQAGRIPGVNPADIAVLMVWLKKKHDAAKHL